MLCNLQTKQNLIVCRKYAEQNFKKKKEKKGDMFLKEKV